jgi:hypothetical protein
MAENMPAILAHWVKKFKPSGHFKITNFVRTFYVPVVKSRSQIATCEEEYSTKAGRVKASNAQPHR